MHAVTMQLSVGEGAAATWTRRESTRVAAEWLLLGCELRGAVLVIGTPAREIAIEPDLIAFFAAEGGAAVALAAPASNASEIAALGVEVYCGASIGSKPLTFTETTIRYQVPILFGDELVLPNQRLSLPTLIRGRTPVLRFPGCSDCA